MMILALHLAGHDAGCVCQCRSLRMLRALGAGAWGVRVPIAMNMSGLNSAILDAEAPMSLWTSLYVVRKCTGADMAGTRACGEDGGGTQENYCEQS